MITTLVLALAPGIQGTPKLEIVLPPSPAQEAWAQVDETTEPAPSVGWASWTDALDGAQRDPWDEEEAWRRWVELLRRERQAEAKNAADQAVRVRSRGELARLALAQGRHEDAWNHLVSCRSEPAVVAALMPFFVPGVPSTTTIGKGGALSPLEPGALLRPALPPPLASDAPLATAQEMHCPRLAVGDSVISLRVALEPDGIQVDLRLVAGPPVDLRVALPEPPGARIGVAYLDWGRLDEVQEHYRVRVEQTEEAHSLWGRFRRRPQPWPRLLPDALTARTESGLCIVVGTALEAGVGRALRFGEALSELLEVPVDFLESNEAFGVERAAGAEPLTLRFLTADDIRWKLPAMIGQAERWALR